LRFFEKIQAKEKAHQGTMSSTFSDHPPTGARIAAVKKEIETILPDRGQYIVTTSEFDSVKARLESLEKQRGPDQRPGTRGRNPNGRRTDPDTTVQDRPDQTQPSDDEPPTIKRKS